MWASAPTDSSTIRSPFSALDCGNEDRVQYTYDANGNILSVSDGTNTTSYVYDSANQLVRENNQAGGFTHIWVYDNAGNIQSRSEYAYTTGTIGEALDTVVYNYGDSQWGDLLTGYDGRNITSDAIGNMLSDGVRSYTWEHGRQLATVTQNGVTWQNTYNADGLRTKRTDGTNTYEYVYYGGLLQYMEHNGQAVYFTHAPDGTPMGMLTEGNAYFYITNLQGDVVGILNSSGQVVVQYTYDAWGNLLSTTGSLASTIGTLNPLRYRGYVYDPETGLYYLQSRYYDPEIGRFLNADAFTSTGQGLLGNNMFAYCGNNPVNYVDPSGLKPRYEGDPAFEWAWDFGWWLKEQVEEQIAEFEKNQKQDRMAIESGFVTYSSKGENNGASIVNSYEIDSIIVMYEFIADNRTDDIKGSSTGVVVEWVFHNFAYKIGKFLGLDDIADRAQHLDVGKTIYSDKRSGINISSLMSLAMKVVYSRFGGVIAVCDMIIEEIR